MALSRLIKSPTFLLPRLVFDKVSSEVKILKKVLPNLVTVKHVPLIEIESPNFNFGLRIFTFNSN
ncbi:hypothetical protein CM15mP43_05160 [bacterium]|nr:MAG: hypothetical protein CM15mP43_05160 [bacterium]